MATRAARPVSTTSETWSETCPCGTGESYAECCRPLHQQQRLAGTAEELMRSRYSAYAIRVDDHVFRTWHPRTRPDDVTTSPALRWEGLTVVEAQDGGLGDDTLSGDGGNTGPYIDGASAVVVVVVDGAGAADATRMSDEVEERLDAEIERCAEGEAAPLRPEP